MAGCSRLLGDEKMLLELADWQLVCLLRECHAWIRDWIMFAVSGCWVKQATHENWINQKYTQKLKLSEKLAKYGLDTSKFSKTNSSLHDLLFFHT